jgi:hypothetical protein
MRIKTHSGREYDLAYEWKNAWQVVEYMRTSNAPGLHIRLHGDFGYVPFSAVEMVYDENDKVYRSTPDTRSW